jgi:hypothetical protein
MPAKRRQLPTEPAPCTVPDCRTGGGGRALCRPCRDRLTGHLVSLPGLFAELEGALVPSAAGDLARRSGPARSGLPLNDLAVDLRSDIRGVLAAWVELVVEARRITAPDRTVPALTAFLRRHVDWLAAHPAAADVAAEIGDLARAARRAARRDRARRIQVGRCVEPSCTGTLTAVVRGRDTLLPATIACDVDGSHTWTSERWHALAKRLKPGAARHGLTAAEIAAGWHVAPGTVYWLASTHKWRRSSKGRQVYYATDDVIRTLGDA